MLWGGEGCSGSLEASDPKFYCSFQLSVSQPFYDLASLTKILVTAPLLLELTYANGWSFQELLKQRLNFPEFKGTSLEDLRIQECWEHTSGLGPFCDFSATPRQSGDLSRDELWTTVLKKIATQQTGPRGETLYSDLGYLLLGCWIERQSQQNLSQLFQAWKAQRGLPTQDLIFCPPQGAPVLPTERRHPTAEVNDDRAAFLQGIAPHAGLFGSMVGVWSWLRCLRERLREIQMEEWILASSKKRFFAGWDQPSDPQSSQAGSNYPPDTRGHLGFTGCALWWSPQMDWAGLLFTNRVYPEHNETSLNQIRRLRREFFTAVWHKGPLPMEEILKKI